MSAPQTKLPFGMGQATDHEKRIILRVPDVREEAFEPPAFLTRRSGGDKLTRGMEVLQRVLKRRRGILAGLSGPNRWQNRLWLAAFSLIGVSCLMLAAGMMQPKKPQKRAFDHDALVVNEFDDEGEAGEGEEKQLHRTAYHPPSAPAGERAEAVIQPVGYETPATPAPRAAWLTGTIVADESEDNSTQTAP